MAIVLVSCVGKKMDHPAPAADLYQSDWFKKARAYAERFGASWYVLSAQYHLVDPTAVLKPYNLTLNTMTAAQRRQWAAETFSQIREWIPVGEVTILAGRRYREHLVSLMEAAGYVVKVPMAHLGIGRQLQWLDAQLAGA